MVAHHPDSTEQKGFGLVAQVLIWGGVLLLIVGSTLAYPYVSSRLAAIPTPTPAISHVQEQLSITSASTSATTITPTALTDAPAPSPTWQASTATAGATSLPQPMPTPALPTHIVIPAIGVDARVVPTSLDTAKVNGQTQTAWQVPAMYAAGWHETSAPLGNHGNTVLNGHNAANGEVFRDLYRLQVGEPIIVYAGDTPYAYAVSETLTLREAGQSLEARLENARHILPTDDERLTLVTCHPYGSLRYRLIVIARPMVDLEENEEQFWFVGRWR